ncbi:two-component regulator propeller domain-containing protein [Cyclobacterium xiamenense]|uniref:two-component regulator propeller domain-containing protein n=1 Tax=Cyclobacterium xiamenense TaxID=1297121 RepID=UPI0012B7624C|nr:two-component regulator propeller domain-containing protein [Cyclobacterium xiamenense]
MNRSFAFFSVLVVWLLSCSPHVKQDLPDASAPTVSEVRFQAMPKERLDAAVVVPAGSPTVIKAGKPRVVPRYSNVRVAGIPKKVKAGVPEKKEPGKNGLPLPKTMPAAFVPAKAIIPEVVSAGEAYQKDENSHNFSSFSKPQGLKSNLITGLLEDQNGNIWFGTQYGGFSKYDGKNFFHYFKKDAPNRAIRTLLEDASGNLLMATQGEGVVRFDGKRFFQFTSKEGLSHDDVYTLVKDSNGNLWMGTLGGGVSKFDGTHVTTYTEKEGLVSNIITGILEDKSGNLWFSSYEGGISKFDGTSFSNYTEAEGLSTRLVLNAHEDRHGTIWLATEQGINKFDGENFYHYTEKEGLSSDKMSGILEDQNGSLWFATRGGGVNKFDGNKFTHFTEKEGLAINYVACMLEQKNGNLWFGTSGGGVSRYTKGFEQFTVKMGLGNDFVSSILEDRSGNLWFGTFSGGVTKYDGSQFVHYTTREGLVHDIVRCMVEDKSGNLWFGTLGGLSKFDGQTFTNYTKRDGMNSEIVLSILEDRAGDLWLGTHEGGVNRFDGENFTQYTDKQGLSNNTVLTLIEDQKGIIWLGTRGGLNRFDGENFSYIPKVPGMGNDHLWILAEDKMGDIWMGTHGDGLLKFDQNAAEESATITQFSINEGLSDTNVTSLFVGRKGDLWVGTSNGLNLLDSRHLSLLDQGGADRLNDTGTLVTTYTYEDGYAGFGLSHGKSIFEASDGTLWLGGDNCLVAFRPEELTKDTTAPTIQLTGLGLFNEQVDWHSFAAQENPVWEKAPQEKTPGFRVEFEEKEHSWKAKDTSLVLGNGVRLHDLDFDDLSRWYGVPENLSLPYDNNFITFQFVGIATQSPKKVRYRYQLAGVDKSWSALTGRSEVPYGNLPHGQYTFNVKALSGEGVWSEVLAYFFEIRPPWWLTWWAYAVYGLLGIGLLVGGRQYTVNRERMKHALKIQKLETEKMYEVDQLKSRFFANISHEFRTPLTLILGPLEKFISRTSAQNPDKTVFQMMQRNAQRLLHLINQLLDLSKIETGSMKLESTPHDLVAFLERMVLPFTSLAERNQIRYHFTFPTGNPVVYMDADKLEKIVSNLLSNAFKFTPDRGEITVTSQLVNHAKAPTAETNDVGREAKWLEIAVQDSGEGIPEDQLEMIFDRFYQLDTSHTREQEGSGIGLSLVKELVSMHQGEISVASQLGKGSCFTVKLPLLVADFGEMAQYGSFLASSKRLQNGSDQEADVRIPSLKPKKEVEENEAPLVLIIEDNTDVRFFIRQHLEATYQVLEAGDGKKGYALAKETIPDLILSDVMMPKMDGVTLCRKLKENDKTAHVPLILLTAKASGGDKIEGLETGADDYLIKPFDAEELLVRIKNLIESRRQLKDYFSREIVLQPSSVAITSADEKFLQRAMQVIEENMTDPSFGVEVFCREVGMSRTQLFRKLKAMTHYPPGDFIRLMRLKKAAELLRKGAGNIGEVAFLVGFQDPSYFTKSFHKQFGKTPSEFINSARKETNGQV